MNYQKIILAGNVAQAAKRRKSKKGDLAYTTFSVGVAKGKDQTTFFPITVFGKHGEAVAKYITKGRQVLVDGRVEVSQKGYFNVVADRVQLGALPKAPEPTKEPKQS